MQRICYSVNGAQVALLTSGICKYMKRAAFKICIHLKGYGARKVNQDSMNCQQTVLFH